MHIKVGYGAIWSAFGDCLGSNFSSEGGFLFYSVAQVHQFAHFSNHCATPGLIIANVLQNVLQLSIVIRVIGLLNIRQQWMVSGLKGSFVHVLFVFFFSTLTNRAKPRGLVCVRQGPWEHLVYWSLKVFVSKMGFKITKVLRVWTLCQATWGRFEYYWCGLILVMRAEKPKCQFLVFNWNINIIRNISFWYGL